MSLLDCVQKISVGSKDEFLLSISGCRGIPWAALRDVFTPEGILTCADFSTQSDGTAVGIASILLVRQRPGKGNAIIITLEVETDIVYVVMWARAFD